MNESMNDCVICTLPCDRLQLPCGCSADIHPVCWLEWLQRSKRTCVLLCDAPPKEDNQAFLYASGVVIRLVLIWFTFCCMVLLLGGERFFALVHFGCAANLWVRSRRVVH